MKTQNDSQLKMIPLGGVSGVNKNMFVYECGPDIIIIDCGVDFPEAEQLGVDVVLPDISYLKDKISRIRGVVITHGHFDHYGALPYLLEGLGNPPVYGSKLVFGLVQLKLEEHHLLRKAKLNKFGSGDILRLGCYELTPFRVNHSVPDSFGFFIRTPVGNIVHCSDFKFDWTPVDGKRFEVGKLASLAREGVLCLLSDCLGSNSEGYTASERTLRATFEREVEKAPGQVFITTVSSNISRIQQAIDTAVKFGREVSLLGMSITQNVEVARNLGYLKVPKGTIVEPGESSRHPGRKMLFLIAGSYGQPGSALVRLAENRHRTVDIKGGAVVIFSADPIPGVFDQVGNVIDKLVEQGARVVYSEIQENLHVSGHGSQGDLAMLAGIVHPSYFVPIGGDPRHMRSYANLIEDMKFERKNVMELREGEGLALTPGKVSKKSKMVRLQDIFVDGARVGDVGRVVIRDRQKLSEEGIFVVILQKGKNGYFKEAVDIVSRGFTYMAISDELVNEAKELAKKQIRGKKLSEWNGVRNKIENRLSGFLYRKTEKNPMILAVLVG